MNGSTLAASSNPLDRTLDYYAKHSPFSDPGRHAPLLAALPSDPAGIARAIQGLVIYEHVAQPFYNCPLPDARRGESHIRPVEKMIDAILALADRPLADARPPEKRLVGICRHFTLLAVATFRHHDAPARARVGFGGYFNPGKYEDHWVCEYWSEEKGRWAMLDVQFDDVFTRKLAIRHDPVDVPRDQFLIAADAWRKCRRGELNPNTFGIEFSKLRGLWFVAGNLIGDLAALNGAEVLPWDVWGAKPPPGELSADQLAFFDELAELTVDPEADFDAMRRRYDSDPSLRLPAKVFNALRQREEGIFA